MLTREVPGHDQADDAERLAEGERLPAGDRDRLAVVLVDGAGVEVEDLRDHADLAARAGDRLADVARLDPRQLLRVLLDELGQAPQQPAAIGGRDRTPGWERRLRPCDGRIGLLHPRPLELGERLLGRGIEDGQHRRYSTIFVSSAALPTADEENVGAENEASQKAVEELVAHYQAKARAVSRAGVAIGAFAGVLVGSIPLSPLRAAWPIPSSYGFATLLGGLVVGVLIGYVIGDPRGKLYQRMAEQARLQLQLEQRISQNDARMGQLLTALTARAAAAAQRPPAAAAARRGAATAAPARAPQLVRRAAAARASRRSSLPRPASAPSRRPSRAGGAAAVAAGLGLALRLPVRPRLVDERAEEGRVLAFLRVPEHADGEALVRILDRLERPVVGPRRLDEPVADRPEALVVVRLDRGALAEQRAEPRPLLHVDLVIGEDARRVLVLLVADDVRQVLDEVAAARDVQHL